ncbi:MAG: hypothetical protein Q4G65_05650 [bacterium]|nr:hypothetical protein [bacterium]
MAALTVTIDVPQEAGLIFDQEALRQQLSAFARILVSAPVFRKEVSRHEDIHVFDGLHTDWGGNADAVEIASSLRGDRSSSRTVGTW